MMDYIIKPVAGKTLSSLRSFLSGYLEKVTSIGGKEEALRSPAVGDKLWQ